MWTFGLSGVQPPIRLNGYAEIDTLIGVRLVVTSAAFVSDDSIFVVSKK